MNAMRRFLISTSWLLWTWCLTTAWVTAEEIDFSHKIVPVLKQHCGKCHAGTQKKGSFSINSRESLLAGGESGPAVIAGRSGESELIARITSRDAESRMPPEGEPLTAEQIALLRRWIDAGVPWEAGFSFGARAYEPPLKPRQVTLPPVQSGRTNPVDRLLDDYLAQQNLSRPARLEDAAFARRVYLDLIGLLPTPEELSTFLRRSEPNKRELLIRELLSKDQEYAEHWLTFWNDLLRNDYAGTGFITGGRKQISKWLYDALINNKPYDVMARELIAPPTTESAGFGEGIRWRGEVSAGQTVEIQFAQSMGQSFLGINLKCASCHDSFIDRWTLQESYGLAAIFSNKPLELHRCDKPIGKQATAAWLFPELGQIDPAAKQPVRLQQLAGLMTHRENGRFTRTFVNRLWHRLMGRGIVHPTDAMQTAPWHNDLLDYLAEDFATHGYNIKHTLELIATSEAYQSRTEILHTLAEEPKYRYQGPRAKRMTAEQFVDCVWQLTSAAPQKFDAPVLRGKRDPVAAKQQTLVGNWIWNRADATQAAANETITFRREWELPSAPQQAWGVGTCDNSFTLYVNGQKVVAGENWEQPTPFTFANRLKAGKNEILIVAKNGGSGPNPAGLYWEARVVLPEAKVIALGTDDAWQWSLTAPNPNGKFKTPPTDWQQAAIVQHADIWQPRVNAEIQGALQTGQASGSQMVRSSLLKSDFLMRSLGRPNRDQIVSVRPSELSTLEAIDLSNGEILAGYLQRGGKTIAAKSWESPATCARWLYLHALSREPTPAELAAVQEFMSAGITPAAVEDVLWSLILLPEFVLVR
jgi:hypothetical protein